MAASPTPDSTAADAAANDSLLHLLAVWLLVGGSLLRLGTALYQVGPAVPLTEIEAALLFETVVVAALWVAGFRPTIGAAALYFVAEQAAYIVFVLVAFGSEPEPLLDAGVHALSIAVAAAFSFTDTGREFRGWLREQAWRLLRTRAVE
jgi:hypothetical protein